MNKLIILCALLAVGAVVAEKVRDVCPTAAAGVRTRARHGFLLTCARALLVPPVLCAGMRSGGLPVR